VGKKVVAAIANKTTEVAVKSLAPAVNDYKVIKHAGNDKHLFLNHIGKRALRFEHY
jgi:hypothetical protein